MIIKSTLFFSKFIFAALILILYGCEADKNANRLNEIKEISVPVKSINPGDEDFSDLAKLKEALVRDSVQIVMLGEQTHGDGTTFLAKTRLIKFLHQQMGFDVLAFESGLYDCTRAWDSILVTGNYDKHIKKAVFPMWVNTAESKHLIDYLQSSLGTESKLELTGFDSQITGYQNCMPLLDEFWEISGIDLTQKEKNLLVKIACLDNGLILYKDNAKYQECIMLMDKINGQFDSLMSKNPSVTTNLGFWKNVISGVKTSFISTYYYKHEVKQNIDPLKMNARDIQMGENLKWLKENKYQNRKIIVWGHNMHLLRNMKSSEIPGGANDMLRSKTSMGDVVHESFGNKMYTIIFTGFEGEYADFLSGKGLTNIPAPSDSSIEFYLRAIGNDISFLNIRLAGADSWIAGEFCLRPSQYIEQYNKWQSSTDGIFYIRKTEIINYN
jgi:erythromycin esterase